MTIRYERETNAPVYLRANGGRVRFGQDEYEKTLDDEIEEHLVAAYDGVEYVDRPESELAADLEELSHAQLKQLARQEGLSGDVDMRSKDILVDALSQAGVDAEAVTEPEPESEAGTDADTTESAPESATAPAERAESRDAEKDAQTAQETAGTQDRDPAPESATTPSERAESTHESTRASDADTNANANAGTESTVESEAAAAVEAEDNAGAEAGTGADADADANADAEVEADPEDEEPTGTLVSTEERAGPNAGRDETE